MFATLARIFPRFRFRRTYCIHALHILSTLFNLFASVIVLNASRMDITRIHVSSSHSHYPLPHPLLPLLPLHSPSFLSPIKSHP